MVLQLLCDSLGLLLDGDPVLLVLGGPRVVVGEVIEGQLDVLPFEAALVVAALRDFQLWL